jgi:5-methylcytosine-specific restriction endonuclease McrA
MEGYKTDDRRKKDSELAMAWARAHPERHRAASARWAAKPESRGKIDVYQKEYAVREKEKISARGKAWRASRPDLVRDKRRRRYERERNALGCLLPGDRERILERFNHRCVSCGKHESECGKLELDHVVPIVEGGRHDADNRQPLCRLCNEKKGRRTTDFRS